MTPGREVDPEDRGRLAWQCRRGMRELDELLGNFLAHRYSGLDDQDRLRFTALLDYPDAVLLELLMGRMQAADGDMSKLIREIRDAATN